MTKSYTSAWINQAARNGILYLMKMMVLMQSDVLPYENSLNVKTASWFMPLKFIGKGKWTAIRTVFFKR